MRFLLRAFSGSYVRQHPGKTLLTVIGVAVGVATYASMQAARFALVDGLRSTVDRVAGRAHLQISGVGGVAEDRLEAVRDVPGLRAVGPVIEELVSVVPGNESLLVLGVDLVGDRALRDYAFDGDQADVDDPLVFLAQQDSIAVARDFADRVGIRTGDPLTLLVRGQPRRMTVRAILGGSGFARAFGGNLAITDAYAAQELFSRGRRFDHLDVRLRDGVRADETIAALHAALGPGHVVETPERRGADMERLIANFTATLDATCALALLIGAYLVSNACAVSVNRRRKTIGILRALGATPRQVQTLVLLEAALLGLVGGAIGLAFGLAVADRLLVLLAGSVETGWGLAGGGQIAAAWSFVAVCLALGVAAALVGAWMPARAAAAVSPTETLGGGRFLAAPQTRFGARVGAGLSLLVLAVVAATWPPSQPWLALLVPLAAGSLAASLLAGPLATMLIARAAPLLARVAPVAGRLAADALTGHLRRTASVAAAMTLALSFVAGTAAYLSSLSAALEDWTGRIVTSDVVVRASARLGPSSIRLPHDLVEQVGRVAGARAVEGFRVDQVPYRGDDVTLVAFDSEGIKNRSSQVFIAGDAASFEHGLIVDGHCALSDNFARRFGLTVGDVLQLDSPTGVVNIPVAAVITSFFSDRGSIMIDRAVFRARWQDDRVDMIHVNLRPGDDPRTAQLAIRAHLSGQTPALVSTRQEFLAEVRTVLDGFSTLTRLAVSMALLVAYLGIVTSLLVSVAERTRELGILKALGASGAQIRRSVVAEALATTGCAAVMAAGWGMLLGRFFETTAIEAYSGFHLPATLPMAAIAELAVALPVVSVIAAWVPARYAAATSVIRAVAHE